MNEQWKAVFGSVARYLLAGITTYLANKGIVTKDQGEFLLLEATAIIIGAVTLLWSWLKNKTQTQLVEAALIAQPGTPLKVVKQKITESE